MTDERRQHERYEELLEVKVTWPGRGERVGLTRNFSDGGTFVGVSFDELPAAGTTMILQLNAPEAVIAPPELTARVVWARADGIAFEFLPGEEAEG